MHFALNTSSQRLSATGITRAIATGPRLTLGERCQALIEGDGAPLLVGAIPFGADNPEFIYAPRAVHRDRAVPPPERAARSPAQGIAAPGALTAFPSEADYARMVDEALALIGSGIGCANGERQVLQKVVLSRQLLLEQADALDFDRLLAELGRDPAAISFRADLSPAGDHLLIGATPEKLVSRAGLTVESIPLAGSMPRGRDAAEDRARAQRLLHSEKDQREHAVTREFVMDQLSPFCSELSCPDGTALHSTASMWHLGTRVVGTLKSADMPSAAGLAAILHPTPAVGGAPREAALAAIGRIEPHDRGFYAGAVGHVDGAGDGEWYIALRCAELRGSRLVLHAGAGIVAGSLPDQEVRETAAKFRAMLRAMGVADVIWSGQEAAQ